MVELAKSTMCGWHKTMAELCDPLIDAMWKDAISTAPCLCTDATGTGSRFAMRATGAREGPGDVAFYWRG